MLVPERNLDASLTVSTKILRVVCETQPLMNGLQFGLGLEERNTWKTCETDAFTSAAIEACDESDGVKDGIISDNARCNFSAYEAVGSYVDCNETTIRLSKEGAQIVQAIWDCPSSAERTVGWFGPTKDTALSTGYAATSCTGPITCGAPSGNDLYSDWLRFFVIQGPKLQCVQYDDA